MARTTTDEAQDSGANMTAIVLGADNAGRIALPAHADFIKDAEILRDGQDLVLETPAGTVVIEGYFNAMPAPVLAGADGAVLTPGLVDSFVKTDGAPQYAQANSLSDASPVGSVTEVSGDATITRADGSREKISAGAPVFEGDIIETAEDAALNIVFIDETSFAISDNARLAIDEYVFDPSTQSGKTDFSILRGLFVFTSGLIGREDPDDVTIDTPMGSIGIRGTIIAGNVDTGEITVMEGAIVLRGLDGSELTLSEQFETARLDAASGTVVDQGRISAEQFSENFASMQPVAADFFSSVTNPAGAALDAATVTTNETQAQPSAAAPTPDAPAQQASPAGPPESGDGTLPPPPPPGAVFPEGGDAGFDDAAATDGGDSSLPPLQSPAGNNTNGPAPGNSFLPPPPPPQNTAPPPADQPPPPPPGGGTTGPYLLNNLLAIDGFTLYGAAGTSGFGSVIAALGDSDNNGAGNFVIVGDDATMGQAFVYNGSGFLNPVTIGANDTSGGTVAAAGDFNGDGAIDYITGAPLSGAPSTGNIAIHGTGTLFSSGLNANDLVGISVAGIGDVNGDGFSDVLAGAPGTDIGGTDAGAAYLLFGNSTATTLDAAAMGSAGVRIDGNTMGTAFGQSVTGAGDFNNDGFADFIVTRIDSSLNPEILLFYGDQAIVNLDNIADADLVFSGVGTDGSDIPVMAMGDQNGDGASDIMIVDTLADKMHVIYGAILPVDTALGNGVNSGGYTIHNSGAGTMEGGSFAGDFNGDGLDDVGVIVRNGSFADLFIIYGDSSRSGNLDIAGLYGDPSQAFRIGYNIGSTAGVFDFSFASGGDINGDGFDDVIIGTPDASGGQGAATILFGRNAPAQGDGGGMVHIAGQTTTLSDVIANADDQALVGNQAANVLNAGGRANIHMSGGAGNDVLVLNNASLGNLDGGAGLDAINFFGNSMTLDFAALGAEGLKGIEQINMLGTGQTIVLGIDDIFRLLQESHNNTLRISAGGNTNNILHIENNNLTNFATDPMLLATDLDAALTSVTGQTVTQSSAGGFDSFSFGGYTLQIEAVLLDGTSPAQIV